MKKALLYSLVGLSLSSISFIAHASCIQADKTEYVPTSTSGASTSGVCAGTNGLNITITTPITVSGGQAVLLNEHNNILRLQDTGITGAIDGGVGNDELVLSGTGSYTISGDITNIENIETTTGTWEFDGNVTLSADKPDVTELTLPWDSTYDPKAPGNAPESIVKATDSSYPNLWEMSSARLIFDNKVTFNMDIEKNQNPEHRVTTASHITAGHVELKQGYAVSVKDLEADPKVIYQANLIDSPDVKDDSTTEKVTTEHDGNWTITKTIDDKGLHVEVKAPDGVLPTPTTTPTATRGSTTSTASGDTGSVDNTDTGGDNDKPTLNYAPSELADNDDIAFGISKQTTKYRTDAVVSHDSNFLDFSAVKNSAGAFQNLSLLEAHLDISHPLTKKAPLLHNTDERNFINLQLGYYHGHGEQDEINPYDDTKDKFKRNVNAYSVGTAIKVYNPFTKKKAGFLKDIWLSTGLDLGFVQQYDVSRLNEDWDQDTFEGKENDLFVTNTILTGIDLYNHFKIKNGLQLIVTPYTGIGFTFIRLGEYQETAKNPLTIDSQYRLQTYGILGVHAETKYKLNNGQHVGVGASLETNYLFNNTIYKRKYSYELFKSDGIVDHFYKRVPVTIGLDANYLPTENFSIFAKASYSTQKIYNYKFTLGMKIDF